MPTSVDTLINQTLSRYTDVRPQVADFIRSQYTTGPLADMLNAQRGMSAHINGAQAVFYSGDIVNAGGDTVYSGNLAGSYVEFQNAIAGNGHVAAYTIDMTAVGENLLSEEGQGGAISEAIAEATAQFGALTPQEQAAMGEPAWRSASEAFASEAVGDVKVFTSETANPSAAFATNELPALLDRAGGGAIEGLAPSDLAGLSATDALHSIGNQTGTYLHDLASGSMAPESLLSQLAQADFSGVPHGSGFDVGGGPIAGQVADYISGAGEILGKLGVAAMGADAIFSTAHAFSQIAAGDTAGALTTEESMIGRLSMGLWGAEEGALIGGEAGFLLGGPAGAAAGGLLGGIIGGVGGAISGTELGKAFAESINEIWWRLGFVGDDTNPPWNKGNILHPPAVDPLVVDLDGNGIQLISLAQSQAHVDFGGDGFAEHVGWVAPNDGFLVIDGNSDGAISVPSELLGSPTQDGFSALAAYDSNHDGKIDANDAAFGSLRIWQDANGDGVAQSSELTTLAQHHIASISLSTSLYDSVVGGNLIASVGSVTHDDGTTAQIGSAYFAVDTLLSKWTPPAGFTVSDAAKQLPELAGYGVVKDLASAMTLDDTLRQEVSTLVQNSEGMSFAQLKSAFEGVLFRWAGADAVDPASRGAYVNAQHLSVLEAFYGTGYSEFYLHTSQVVTNPTAGPAVTIEAAYQNLLSSELLQFAGQMPTAYAGLNADGSHLASSPYAPLALLSTTAVSTQVNFDASVLLLQTMAPTPANDALAYYSHAMPVLAGAIVNVFGEDAAAFSSALRADFAGAPGWGDVAVDLATLPLTKVTAASQSVTGGAATDVLWATGGNDTIDGGAGDDVFLWARGDGAVSISDAPGYGFSDRLDLAGLHPSDVTLVRNGADFQLVVAPSVAGGSDGGTITLVADQGENGGQGVDRIEFADGTTWTRADMRALWLSNAATTGNDTITGFNVADTLAGGHGNDSLQGGSGDDTYVYSLGDGNDTISDGSIGDPADVLVLHGIAPSAVTLQRPAPDDLVLSFSDGGSVKLAGEFNSLGWNALETIKFDDGTSWSLSDVEHKLIALAETPGNDVVTGFAGADTLDGGAGNDTLQGGAGDDTFVYSSNTGADVIDDLGGRSPADQLVLHGITPSSVTLTRPSADDFTMQFAGGGSVTVLGEFNSLQWNTVESVKFDDGTTWSLSDIERLIVAQSETSGNDVVTGFSGADTLDGGAGNDTLQGGAGDDTYVYTANTGDDVIDDLSGRSPGDQLLVHGVTPANVTLIHPSADDVVLQFAGGGSVKLLGEFNSLAWSTIETIKFDDGTTWTPSSMTAQLNNQVGGAGNDNLIGFAGADTLDGGAGNDTLSGAGGDDLVIGGAGDDSIDGGAGTDTISYAAATSGVAVNLSLASAQNTGGAGVDTLANLEIVVGSAFSDTLTAAASNSTLVGGAGDDALNGGAGNDSLDGGTGNDVLDGGAGNDVLDGGTGVNTASYASAGVAVTVSLATTSAQNTGGAGSDTLSNFQNLIGSAYADTLTGTSGANSISGGDGADSITGGGGADTIDGGNGSDTVGFSGAYANYSVSGTLANLIVRNLSTGEVTNLSSVEHLAFSDQTVDLATGPQTISGGSGNDVLNGGLGDDSISGNGGNDTLTGGGGNDNLQGGGGDDLYNWSHGDGSDTITDPANGGSADKLILQGVSSANVTLVRSGNDLTLQIAPSTPGGTDGGAIKLVNELGTASYNYGPDQIVLSDVTWTPAQLRAAVILQSETSGNDTIVGFGDPNTIVGGAGNDVITGGGSNDTYSWARGDGVDTITDGAGGGAGDKLTLQGLSSADVTLVRSGNDLTLQIAPSTPGGTDGGAIKLVNELGTASYNYGPDQIILSDVTWTPAQLRAAVITQSETSGNDTIVGFGDPNTIVGGAGNDVITGGGSNDTYSWARGDGVDTITDGAGGGSGDKLTLQGVSSADVTLVRSSNDLTLQIAPSTPGGTDGGAIKLVNELGTASYNYGPDQIILNDVTWTPAQLRAAVILQSETSGNDTIVGFGDPNTIVGGAGNDVITGGGSNDTYSWARGDGVDTITDGAGGGAGDKLTLQGVSSADVTLVRSGNDLTLQIAPSTPGGTDGGAIKLVNELGTASYNYGPDQIVLNDVTWTPAQLRAAVITQAQTSGNDSIVGFDDADTIAGGAGADTITGGASADVFKFNAVGDSSPSQFDIITDFVHGTDKIDLAAIDANSGLAGDQAFTFIGTAAFSHTAGELRYALTPSGSTTVYGDVDGDGVADFQVQLTGNITLQSSDFLL